MDAGNTQFFYIDDYDFLKRLKKQYNQTTSIFNEACESWFYTDMYLLREKKVVEEFRMHWDCNKLETKCGPIKFDFGLLNSAEKECSEVAKQEKWTSFEDLNHRISALIEDKEVVGYTHRKKFKETFKFYYEDPDNEIETILEDEFWFKLAKENIREYYQSEEELNKAKDKIGNIGLLLEMKIRMKFGSNALILESWNKIETEIPKYLISISNIDQFRTPQFQNIIAQTDESAFFLHVLRVKK